MEKIIDLIMNFAMFFGKNWNGFIFGIIIIFVAGTLLYVFLVYRPGAYYKVTHRSFLLHLRLKFDAYLLGSTNEDKDEDLGCYGEYLIYKCLRKYEKSGARFLFNIYMDKKDGGTTEADVVMIDSRGIFVFESKNYSGWIFGSGGQKMWTQSLPAGRNSRKTQFLNPVFQNKLHIETMKEYVNERTPFFSVIVFSERCVLKNVNVKEEDVYVVKRDSLNAVTAKIMRETDKTLSRKDIDEIYGILYPLTQKSDEIKENHIKDIKEKLRQEGHETQNSAEENDTEDPDTPDAADKAAKTGENISDICPMCGAPLILRRSTKGAHRGESFCGCSAFPKCRYIKPIEKSDG